MTTAIIIVLGVIAGAVIGYAMKFDGKYTVERSIVIDKPINEVYSAVIDFKSWQQWSPWLYHDKDTKLVFSDNPASEGGYYTWESEKIGVGKITHKELLPPSNIAQHIEFVKPFKSAADVYWKFENADKGTKVTWGMRGRLPFLMRWWAPRMPGFISKDYDSGLAQLRHYVDPTSPNLSLSFDGVFTQPHYDCMGRQYKGSIAGISSEQQVHFAKIMQIEGLTDNATALSLFTAFDEKHDTISIDYGVSPPPDDEKKQEGYIKFSVPAGEYFRCTLTGDYNMLQHAWHHAFADLRMSKLKFDKKRYSYELYKVGPHTEDDPDKYITEIYLPVIS